MEGQEIIKPNKPARRAVIICAVISPFVFLLLNSWPWLRESLGMDIYGNGRFFYFVAISTTLLISYLIVRRYYPSGNRSEKIAAVARGTMFAILWSGIVILIAWGIYVAAFTSGHWAFG